MYSDTKTTRLVADAVTKIMMGEKALHPNQQKLDVHEPEKDELTADDFKKLRAGKKAPEVKKDEIEEGYFKRMATDKEEDERLAKQNKPSKDSMRDKVQQAIAAARLETKAKEMMKAKEAKKQKVNEEEVENKKKVDDLPFTPDKPQKNPIAKAGKFGIGPSTAKHLAKMGMQKTMKSMKEEDEQEKPLTFSEMIAAYKEYGLPFIAEEPTQEEYEKEIKKAQAKSEGKEKAEVAKAAVQAVKQEETEIQVINADVANGVEMVDIEERMMTEPEMKKKEEIVKSMKKGMAGFKERYGERAKNVMYATATKKAMGEEVEQIEEGTPEGYQRRDGRLIPKIHSKMTPHEHGYDYTMQSIEDAPSKTKIHSQHKEIIKDNPHPQGSKEHKDWKAGTNKAKADHLKDFS